MTYHGGRLPSYGDDLRVVASAPGAGAGNWAGAASAVLVDGVFWLTWRVRRVIGRDPLTVLYDGRPDAASNWSETTGVAVWDGERLVPDPSVAPIASPYGDGAFRYASAVPLGDGRTRYYVEAARDDGAHDLVTFVR